MPKAEQEKHYMEQRETIMANESGPEAGVEGVVEDMKGRAKEAAGAVSGNESLTQEGQAQQDKAAALRDAAAKEAEAEKARAQATAAEARAAVASVGPEQGRGSRIPSRTGSLWLHSAIKRAVRSGS